MKKLFVLAFIMVSMAAAAAAAEIEKRYSFHVTSSKDGGNRQVVVGDTVTGNFEIYDIDNKGLDRKTNEEYYPCHYFDVKTKKRYVKMVKFSSSEE